MKTLALIATAALAATGLTACAAGSGGGSSIPFCVDDALVIPEANKPRPTRTSRPSRPRTTKPSTKRTTKTTTRHYDDHDCD
jgi:hypothetical protein